MHSLINRTQFGQTNTLAAGDTVFHAGHHGMAWQLQAGALRLDIVTREGGQFAHIALPGDLLALEVLAAYPYTYTAKAIVPSRVRACAWASDAERRIALIEGMVQQQRRNQDLVTLRTGPAQERLKHLLLLLAPEVSGWDTPTENVSMPTIKDVAAIIDTSPETVSRIFANLKRTHIVAGRKRQSVSFSHSHLRDAEWPTGMTRSNGSQRMGTQVKPLPASSLLPA